MSVHDQLNRLTDMGLIIPDRELAVHSLRHIGYHRLSGYWRPLQVQPAGGDYAFREGAGFDDVIAYYDFDGRLRSTVAESLGKIEVSARALWARHLADEGGEQAHLRPALFTAPDYQEKLDELKRSYQRNVEPTGSVWQDADIWEITEAMSFGQLSKWYNAILLRRTRNAIARHYRMNHIVLSSILFNMAHLRNICAHHGRLWNRNLYTGLRIPNALAAYCNLAAKEGIYNRLVIIAYLMDIIAPRDCWPSKLQALLDDYPNIPKDRMGFPHGWEKMAFWK